MGEATEELAARTGPGISGLVNVTFGNAPELIIALLALAAGLQEVVRHRWSGLRRQLLVISAAMLAGAGGEGARLPAVATASGMLLLPAIGPDLPRLVVVLRRRSAEVSGCQRVGRSGSNGLA